MTSRTSCEICLQLGRQYCEYERSNSHPITPKNRQPKQKDQLNLTNTTQLTHNSLNASFGQGEELYSFRQHPNKKVVYPVFPLYQIIWIKKSKEMESPVQFKLMGLQQMIEILGQYILGQGKYQSVESLIEENENLKAHIAKLQGKVSQIDLKGYEGISQEQKLDQILSILTVSELQLSEEQKILSEQSSQIKNLVNYIELYLQQQGIEPRVLSNKIKELKSMVEKSEEDGYPQSQVQKMNYWNKKLIQSLQKKLCDLVCAFNTHFRIRADNITCYKDLLNQQICRQFVKLLYKDIITYDVPTFSYILMVPKEEKNVDGTVIVQRQAVIFTCQKAQQYYNEIKNSIGLSYKLSQMIASLFGEGENQYRNYILDQIQKSQQNVKAQIQYILPYLSLNKRKQIIETLCTKSSSESSLYDILVRLRIKGQDGEMMASNIKQLVQKLKSGGKDSMDEATVFLQICQSQDKALNIGFYICNELINSLEGYVDYNQIQRLLTLREEMRFRIHHPV